MKRTTKRELIRWSTYAVAIGLLVFFASRFSLKYNWRWEEFVKDGWLQLLLQGFLLTIQVSLVSMVVALPLGVLIGLLRTARDPGARLFGFVYVEIVRGTPLLVQVMIWYWVIGKAFALTPFSAAVCALSCFAASYIAEIVRAGIQGVDRGQMEAARSLGLSHFKALRFIILPQALRKVMPPLASEFIALVKDSSLASVIGLVELAKRAGDVNSRVYMAFEPWVTAAILYLIINIILSWGVRRLEKRMGVSAQRETIR